MDIQHTLIDQVTIDGGNDVAVILHLVDATIDIIIHPMCWNGDDVPLVGAAFKYLFRCLNGRSFDCPHYQAAW